MDVSAQEYEQRLAATQQAMEKAGLPALLLHQPESVRYLSGLNTTGFFSYHALLVPARGKPILVIRDVEESAARHTAWVKEWTTYADAKDPLPAAIAAGIRALDQAGLAGSKIGVDFNSWYLTPERLQELRRQAPRATFVEEPKIVDHLRLIKSKAEIEIIRRAARAVEAGMRGAIAAVKTGVSERELAAATYSALVLGGGDVVDGVITSGERTLELHGRASDRRIQDGDPVYYELTGYVEWYVARIIRSVINGKPTDAQLRVADAILSVQDAGIAMMRPGVVAGEVDKVFREGLLRTGVRKSYTNRSAYSIGMSFRATAGEFIRELVPGVDWTFEPGMVFHVLMMAQGIGFSETILITENGPERITTMERKLFSRG